jgi:gamma-glutamyltranspeptidase/glutathione hydrolase
MSRIAGLAVLAVLMALVAASPAGAAVPAPHKTPTAEGRGGSAASVDPLATQAAIRVLRSGGNAVDAAIAAAGVLGVVEPFSCGIGGGGFMVVYDARRHRVDTIDSREKAPARLRPDAFADLDSAVTAEFTEARVGGLSVGVPGTVRGWQTALRRYGTRSLGSLLKPGERIARKGFVIDSTFSKQVADNEEIFDDFTATRDLYLTRAKTAKPAGTVQRNRDLARTYKRIGADPDQFYHGAIARDIARTVRHPREAPDSDRPHAVRAGSMTLRDLARYRAIRRKPTRVRYRGLDVYGMGPPSSGGSTVGEALNILEGYSPLGATRAQALHRYLEASKLAYADRSAYLADPAYFDVPLRGLLSDPFAAARRKLIKDDSTLPGPQPADPDPARFEDGQSAATRSSSDAEGHSTTHLTVADRFGNVVSYTFTIEQTGGNGIVVPDRGFLLNNELTDFNFSTGTPNSPAPRKRPRSSISPTLVFRHGRPALALGSPGGATIVTTVLQILVNHIDFGQSLPDALAAPRASQRNAAPADDAPAGTLEKTEAEPGFIEAYGAPLQALGHSFTVPTAAPPGQIGAATGIRFLRHHRQQSVAEPTRRGGGSAMVVRPG